MHMPELLISDFREWFEAEASSMEAQAHNIGASAVNVTQRGDVIEFKAKTLGDEPSAFAKLLAKCARKSMHLSVPIQTFVPVSL